MQVSREEATSKMCPVLQHALIIANGVNAEFMGYKGKCVASECMWWVEANIKYQPGATGIEIMETDKPIGHCGKSREKL